MRYCWLLLTITAYSFAEPIRAEETIVFSRDVLPILSDNCFQCHGPDAEGGRKGELRLDDEEDVKRSRGDYRVIDREQPAESELLARITSDDEYTQMPPPELGRSLSRKQKETLRLWIEQGAEWGRHWAFEPIERPKIDDAQTGHPIDVLVAKQLARKGWKPNGRAARETLIRRLSLDLTGLPPTPEQVDRFLSDGEPGAWDRLVDRTLASPAYGERMAWNWMEVARYSDSNGYQGDNERTMWPWRDWVVKAFNSNMPFDEFTVNQLAGDLLPEATKDQILATGFCRNHMINGEGGRIPEENRVDYVFDMTETMGTAWLGLTLNCCRCHDHKFDPLTQEEYYQFTAFFNQTPVTGGGRNPQTPPVLPMPDESQATTEKQLLEQIAQAEQDKQKRLRELASEQAAWEESILARGNDLEWEPLHFNKLESRHGQTLTKRADGTILATGKNPDNDTYELVTILDQREISALLVEAVRHPKMTRGGFARSDSGNFVLTEVEIDWRPEGETDWKRSEINSGQATFEQGGLKIEKSFDGNSSSGWAVLDGKSFTRDQWAVLKLVEPIDVDGPVELRIVLRHDSPHKQHNLGHFRISASRNSEVELPKELPRSQWLVRIPEEQRSVAQRTEIREAFANTDQALREHDKQIATLRERLDKHRESYPKVMVMRDMEQPRKTFLLDRGLYNQPQDEVTAAVPAFLPMLPDEVAANRLGLSRWLVSDENPLTARVIVNRYWQMLFGIGLVKTPEDFGVQGEYPPQKELLDWLAADFIASDWDVKHLMKTIVTSETYRRSSRINSHEEFERDPENRYFARGPRFRLPSWMIRDSALAASGLLNRELGGRPVYPYQPEGIWSEATFGKKNYKQDSGENLYRRSLYVFWRRIVGPTMFFDTAKRQVCEVKPVRTNTPLQALTIMNDITYVEAARALAELVLKNASTDQERLGLVYRRVLSRVPSEDEEAIALKSLSRARAFFMNDVAKADEFLSHGEYQADEEISRMELAAWAALCLNLFNLDEALTKE